MPPDNGLRLDDDQAGPPAFPESSQPNPEDAVPRAKGRAFVCPLEDRQLLTQGQVLHGQGSAVCEKESKENADCRKDVQSEAVLSMVKASIVTVKSVADKKCKCL